MKKMFLILSVVLLAAACSSPTSTRKSLEQTSAANSIYDKQITVASQTLKIFLANTDALRAQGLSGISNLSGNEGMLFEFAGTPYDKPGFWMKDMKINLDLIWIKNGKIIGITKNVPTPPPGVPDAQLPLYFPPSSIDKVLEVNAGWADKHNVKIGDTVAYSFTQN